MRSQSPWSTIIGAAAWMGFALYGFATAYAPPDTTPLQRVEGSISNVSTTWIYHSYSRGGGSWNAPVVTVATSDGGSIHFTAHSRNESPAVLSLGGLTQGAMLRAQVDASGEIWELSVNDKEAVPLADTLARHHALASTRNMICGFMVLLGVGLGVFGFKRLQAGSDIG